MGSYKMGIFFTRKFKIGEGQPPADVKAAFEKFSQGGKYMSAEQLRQFLVEFQGENDATVADAKQIIEHVLQQRHHITKSTRDSLTFDDFYHYVFSGDLNDAIRPQVHQDMSAPLSHYFIYTGHNSYLTGNQLSSDCSDIPIINALKSGVKVIELDIWPNDSKDDVDVLHGRTLTTPVELIKCLRSIKENAFSASPYPVIITLEDHLSSGLQAKVAEMVLQTFGEMLFYPKSNCLEEFPSPEALKYRIILSTKPPKEYLHDKSIKKKENDSEKGKESSDDEAWEDTLDQTAELEIDDKSDSDTSEQNQADEDSSNCSKLHLNEDSSDCSKLQLSGVPKYKHLIAIHARKPKGGIKEVLRVISDKVTRLSLSEQKLEKAATSHGTDLVRFTQKNFLRIYPKGTRFNSSNYNPLIGWMHGAQMVAFNMQGYGKSLWLMHGMFRSNGGCGYVKKPDFLMKAGPHNEIFNPKATLPVKKTLKVKAYMGDGWRLDFKKTHFDTYSPPDFYVKIGTVGVPADTSAKKTKVMEDEWRPVWDEEFIFPLTVPELALLRIVVREHDRSEKDDFGGQTCLPVSELRPGIRTIPLFNRKGEKLKSVKLLMRFVFV